MNEMIRIVPPHFEHESGSTKYTFWINLAQFLRNFFLDRSDSVITGAGLTNSTTQAGSDQYGLNELYSSGCEIKLLQWRDERVGIFEKNYGHADMIISKDFCVLLTASQKRKASNGLPQILQPDLFYLLRRFWFI